ncbi:MAG: hypothetical protein AAFQ42_09945 [Pseudomonadota bacterium]
MNFANLFSWFGTLMAVAVGLVISVLAGIMLTDAPESRQGISIGYALLFLFTLLFPLGLAATVSGGLGLILRDRDVADRGLFARALVALLIGLFGVALGLLYGVPFA